jgi:hypothetical protein
VLLFLDRFFSVEDVNEITLSSWIAGVPSDFEIKRKATIYLRGTLLFVSFALIWTGAWNIFDYALFDMTLPREYAYTFCGLAIMFLFEVILSPESLYWLIYHYNKRRGVNTGEQPDLAKMFAVEDDPLL